MEQNLISKKELLDLMGISYGQLYRWKRKNLIPEDWFIKKSSFTGQETFFPKEKMLNRISKIMNMKEGLSLEDIAGMVSPNPVNVSFTKEELMNRGIISEFTLNFYLEHHKGIETFNFDNILVLNIIDRLLKSGDINKDEGVLILNTMEEIYPKFEGKPCELFVMRKLGITSCCMNVIPGQIYFDEGVKIIARINIAVTIEELKLNIA
ncbi:MAG: DUF4004 family protein [Ignavibacteriae bacterium]|nr:MAG: DUF4004 family protein [Ignavibacteriota bacterium]